MTEPRSPEDAATVIVTTHDGCVLVGRRSMEVPFLGGYLSFPGGKVAEEDRVLARAELAGDPLGPFRAAAIRELAEEAGIRAPEVPKASSLEYAGRWVTPDSAPLRYDTRFFVLVIGEPLETRPDPRECEWMRFMPVEEVLEAYRRFEILLPTPTKLALEILALGAEHAARRLLSASRTGELDFEPVSGIRQLPLRTPTLPPARHTNTYVVGHERLLVVDPATYETEEREKLADVLDGLGRGGAAIEAIVLTHHHVDHVGAARWLSERTGARILAHPITRDLLKDEIRVDADLEDGDLVRLGRDCAGQSFDLRVLHTPGHAPGHIVLDDQRAGAASLIAGDMVAGIGTIIVDPPEGNMAEYIRQLERLRDLGPRILFPAHGPPIVDGQKKLGEYIAHRRRREAKVREALAAHGRGTATSLLDRAYDDTPPELYPLAARACLAHLEKLVEDGLARREGAEFVLVA